MTFKQVIQYYNTSKTIKSAQITFLNVNRAFKLQPKLQDRRFVTAC